MGPAGPADANTPVLTQKQWQALGDMLRELGIDEQTAAQIRNGGLSAKEVLALIRNTLSGAGRRGCPPRCWKGSLGAGSSRRF